MTDLSQTLPEIGIGGILIWVVNRMGALETRMDAMMSAMHIAPKKNRRWRNTLYAAVILGTILLANGCGRLQPVTP